MKLLVPFSELPKYKCRDLLPVECHYCHKSFHAAKNNILWAMKRHGYNYLKYCSRECRNNDKITQITIFCKQCRKRLSRVPSAVSDPNHCFCSKSCAATWNNCHKTKGCRRSKLEFWLETELTKKFPSIKIDYNKTDAINSELDIYIPSLKLAFELNGIFHYEPIYGLKKLQKMKSNDDRKFQACLEKKIELCLLDVSNMKYFKSAWAVKFFEIITGIIERKLADSTGVDPDSL